MNNCTFTVQVPREMKKSFSPASGDKKAKLFIPLLNKKYMGPDKDAEWTSIPAVFFAGYAEMMEKVLKPGMRLTIRAEYRSYYDRETGKEHTSFVVQEHEIQSFGKSSSDSDFTDYEEEDEDDFPF